MKETPPLIPFDLNWALNGEPLITRGGYEVTEIHLFKTLNDRFSSCPVRVIVCGKEEIYNTDGTYYLNNGCEHQMDLFMAPKPAIEYRSVFTNGICNISFGSLEETMDYKPTARSISICKLTILNGEVIAHETVHRY